ncbi:MAG: 3-deoxy-D-manno-octulosonic acid transferase [Proteobacteria bacterium]|nr:3-deoxy-D-manno-octulosonic acid transferase [Pseudomonadota bacterium]
MWSFIYNLILFPLSKLLARIISPFNNKIKSSVIGKKSVWKRLPEQIKNKDNRRKLIWFHAPSAGEFIQLQPLLEKFLNNDFECIVTYNSISAEKWINKSTILAKRQPLFLDYLPFDSKKLIRQWLDSLQPDALVFIKYDLWPNTIWETFKAGIPVYLVSATLNQKTKRYVSRIGRSFYRSLYSSFQSIFVVEEDDKKRFLETNPGLTNVKVFGDIRYDATLDQRERKVLPSLPKAIEDKFVFILGSNWPPDEECVFSALKKAMETYADLFLIIAPHEPTESHLATGESFFGGFGTIRLTRLDQQSDQDNRVLMIDSVGILSALYKIGNLGYIGGGFTTGVHNVMEPCAMGLPVFFGPKHYNSGEALQLSRDGLAFSVSSPHEFETKLFDLLKDRNKITELGEQAKKYIENQAGATGRSYEAIVKDIGAAIN